MVDWQQQAVLLIQNADMVNDWLHIKLMVSMIQRVAIIFLITYETQHAPASLSKRPSIGGVLAAT
jgi:hypothetical protein